MGGRSHGGGPGGKQVTQGRLGGRLPGVGGWGMTGYLGEVLVGAGYQGEVEIWPCCQPGPITHQPRPHGCLKLGMRRPGYFSLSLPTMGLQVVGAWYLPGLPVISCAPFTAALTPGQCSLGQLPFCPGSSPHTFPKSVLQPAPCPGGLSCPRSFPQIPSHCPW